ncbi:hypothetical protein Sked_29010 [Sanguibacter keddieii DSM 10542]|uniref:Uncharacterized protein n=1 Tax=Sanguibacter keddieii (strain ATCC 51767 / DSM 10542 / NCFB 3025 / ST-74) TaxID=446469 RepID=D1BBN2_SANKS|nr:hypothetical protein [Sanguibacter keddieii]ACZ22803.1 hypothetical protein Sked_29010 [Sanguibacter keddieii DSM 10542]
MTARAWTTLLVLSGLVVAQIMGLPGEMIDRAGEIGIGGAASIQEHVGGLVAPEARMQQVDDLTTEIDALG